MKRACIAIVTPRGRGSTVEYVARDLARLTSPQIHDHLAQLRLVAPRRPASVARG